jgi:formylglycine-generating enzyme required for sulfatase activity
MNKMITLGLLSVVLWLTGCSQPLEGIIGRKDFVKDVTGVSLNKDTLALYIGGTTGIDDMGTLTATVAPGNATNKKVTWTSSDDVVATVNDAGVVTAVALGVATITVKTEDGNKTATCNVEVANWFQEMVLATPSAVDPVTITGKSVYYYLPSPDYWKGVFIEDRTVTLSPFRIAKHETTYELWYEVRQWAVSNGYMFANEGQEGHDGTDGAAPTAAAKTEPATDISWRDAVIWCNAYSEMSGKEPVYRNGSNVTLRDSNASVETQVDITKGAGKDGYRLPTEAEWEYAARGGGTPDPAGSFAYKWAGTDTESDLVNYAWYSVNSGNATHPVGGKTENSLGLKDMSGNVWEWCWDWHGPVGTGPETDPKGSPSGSVRVLRGGSWLNAASFCAVALRGSSNPDYGDYGLGFRVVCP